ncbi:predicted protein [Postia placenta Mad-698-R]|uniref:Uncharacterized protein n=1 Tax=Postia placenta MAD-698-R-SB12 TaxID=670580 RepID=A0A1X6N9C0_9APHY|nr:hypothetical protein POSPLADRAFT_1134445 [Postia placenta MAD-698-R-SB12]EED84195.1 predicted protein [Postia placenta Mad-698-R]OSX65110.1 hypothetical protein POSPLADRAFT_1134445 [Postia placenta MAD-698-R-SB12]
MSTISQDSVQEQGNSFYAALARTATRSLALYFSRPVRLFRPSKVNGWQTLKKLATHHGQSLSPQYLSWLVRQQGYMVIPKHFIPPMVVNGLLGVVLWSTYTEVSDALESRLSTQPIALAAIAGASAGGIQALIAAPAENVRLAIEGGSSSVRGWSYAWKEVFRGTQSRSALDRHHEVHEARQVRDWMREVGDMAGRGWDGWGWGCAKDICGTKLCATPLYLAIMLIVDTSIGFAVFFSIFEVTRRFAMKTKAASNNFTPSGTSDRMRRHIPRVVHATTLVTGGAVAGLAYELTCRPWDIARKAVHVDRLRPASERHSILVIILRKIREDGIISYFQDPNYLPHHDDQATSPLRRRVYSASRTLARHSDIFVTEAWARQKTATPRLCDRSVDGRAAGLKPSQARIISKLVPLILRDPEHVDKIRN